MESTARLQSMSDANCEQTTAVGAINEREIHSNIFTGWLFVYRRCAQSGSSLLEPRRHLRVALARRRAMPRVQRLLDHHERRACNVRAHEEER